MAAIAPKLKTGSTSSAKPEPQFNSNNGKQQLAASLIQLITGEAPPIIGDVEIVRTGDKIILPDSMSFDEGIHWLKQQKEAHETVVTINHSIPGMPLDALHALWRAFNEVNGYTKLGSTSAGFWSDPPHLMRVDIGANGQFVQVPYCKLVPPNWEGGYLEPFVRSVDKLLIRGEVKKKFEDKVKKILELAENFVRTESIYKGKAVTLDLSFLPELEKGNIRFDPTKHRPMFLDLSNVTENDLILNQETQHALDISILLRLKQAEACRENRIPIKHGVLMTGGYGTGKSTTGMVVGSVAEKNGYTFIFCKSPDQIVQAMEVARMYSPAVLFCEDIDPIVSGERTAQMNAILEGLDGIEAKGQPVIFIATTNFVQKINPAFMRPGRIDTLVHFDVPSAETAAKFVTRFTTLADGSSLLEPNADMLKIGEATEGYVPAVISEVVQSAKARALLREGSNIVGKVTTNDMLVSSDAKKKHIELTKDKPVKTHGEAAVDAMIYLEQTSQGYFDSTAPKLN